MERLTLPDCVDCGHAARHHADRAVSACAVDIPPHTDGLGRLCGRVVQPCKCLGYRAVPR